MAVIARFHEQLEQGFRQLEDSEDGWELILDGLVPIYRKLKGSSSMLLKFVYPVPMPFEQFCKIIRPEAAIVEDLICGDDIAREREQLRIFAPGDCVVRYKLPEHVSMLMSIIDSDRFRRFGNDVEEASCFLMRMVYRRDFPRIGCSTMVGVELRDGWEVPADYLDYAIQVASSEDGASTCTEVFQVARTDASMLRPMIQKMLELYGAGMERMGNVDEAGIAELEANTGYTVLSLRKCSRGPPLVPSLPPGQPSLSDLDGNVEAFAASLTWTPLEDATTFNLSGYLRPFLELLEKDPTLVYQTLDGRPLIFFQATMRISLWKELSEAMQVLVRRQQATYRQRFGGSGAPYVQADAAPRFCDRGELHASAAAFDDDEATFCVPGSSGWSSQVKNTFLHFSSRESVDMATTVGTA